MISRLFAVGLFAAMAAIAGCSQDEPVGDSVAADTSDLAHRQPRLLGTINPGETKYGYYYLPPQPRAWAFHASAGDTITIDVRSKVGDAIAYLTDDQYNVISYNDDAEQHTSDSKIVYTLPPSTQQTSFRIVFADYDSIPAPFDVALSIDGAVQGGLTCTYGSNVYHVGDKFPARDGCNTCTCTQQGVDCTKDVCACDPNSEPDKVYMYSPEQCLTIHVTCSAGWQPFSNSCGCGCKTL